MARPPETREIRFRDRSDAGRRLAELLRHLEGDETVVLGLPRGGVPVAAEVASGLRAPLDVVLVRKLGVPVQRELAMGAIGERGVRVINDDIVRSHGVTEAQLAGVEALERAELERRVERYRGGRPMTPVAGRTAIVVDDGIATGSTARAACAVVRALGARRVVLAVPVAARSSFGELAQVADEMVCVTMPSGLRSVGEWYADFTQTTDDEVIGLLDAASDRSTPGGSMFFRQYQLPCLSIFSYLIGDTTTGRAVVVDPQRDISGYIDDARANGLSIERVIETHFHADFLSGHLEMSTATGAVISYGDEASADFPIDGLVHGQRLELGEVVLEVRHTPGHTPESISLVVWEHGDDTAPWAVLTGDTLFVGDVGRPDLLTSVGCTADDLARQLYRSLHEQLLTLPDGTRVFPAHGAGSACGKSMSDAVSSTIGEQRSLNYALRPMTEAEFVEAVTQGQSVAPHYFAFTADSNRRVHDLLDDEGAPAPLTVDDVERLQREGALVIDGRAPETFASGHIRGSVNVGLDGRFAEYAGDVARPGQRIVVVTDAGREVEARVRLARIGFDQVLGALSDVETVLAERPELATRATRIAAADLGSWSHDQPALQILDVRNPGEQEAGVVPNAVRIPLAQLLDRFGELDPATPTVVYCAGGYRSSIAASLLRSFGFDPVADVQGGFAAWSAAGLPVAA